MMSDGQQHVFISDAAELGDLVDSVVMPTSSSLYPDPAVTEASSYSLYPDPAVTEIKRYLEEPLLPGTAAAAAAVTAPAPLSSATFDIEDFNLAAATLQAAATGSNGPIIKEELRYSIQRKRRLSGLRDLTPDYKPDDGEKLSAEEELKRADRRARNKIAAKKCREKNKCRVQRLQSEHRTLEAKHCQLTQEVRRLEEERERLSELINVHLPVCRLALPALPSTGRLANPGLSSR